MRQAGIIAAASLHALTKMSKRIHEDTENAKKLAEVVAKERGFNYYVTIYYSS
jgi:threonine aldolase